ncbi:helix-turn-helix transcriptional regulator [Carnobacterium viridans]|uniref:Helix-turn-helix domain-containing protein n=1 Tax=Carnobacterium viridans TaxID=174587 RepID=A0A1H0YDT3_9LACT|nr:helix-turn-helix transcriptional regulator [Carnobacterium viridans]UDE95195.1 helix-turn-helix transcriptional regulator [Carnobacterium viridans]SDQ13200.1 Helix-turn-helix domain-containing protein [Carnobacterium viridans]
MTDTNVPIGSTLKKIRENKGYTQKEVSDHTMARSTYTKFENDDITPTLSKYLAILDHMDMSHEEFIYLLNDFELGQKETILYLFKQLDKNPTLELIYEIIEKGELLVQDRYDQLTLDILNACRGYAVLFEEQNLAKAKDYAQEVWNRMETLDKWYLAELHIINSILYLFDSDTAALFTERALETLTQYQHLDEARNLKISFLLHLTNLLMMDQKYEQALFYIKQMETESARMDYAVMLATALVRKEVCMKKVDDTSEPGLIDRAVRIFDSLDKQNLKESVLKDPENFLNLYSQYPADEIKDELITN